MELCFVVIALGIVGMAVCMACGWDKVIWAALQRSAHQEKSPRAVHGHVAAGVSPEQDEWRREFGTTSMAAFEAYSRGNAMPNADDRIRWYSKAIELDPGYVRAYNARGLAHRERNDYDHAIADHCRAIELDPRCAHAYNSLAIAYWAKGDYAHTWEVIRAAEAMGLHNAASQRLLERLQKVPVGWMDNCRPAHVH